MTEYKEIKCASVINRMSESLFTIRTYSIRLTANPYSGCIHNCAWCYAQYIHKFNVRYDATVTPKDFSKKVFVKINAPEILEQELQSFRRKKLPLEFCDLSTITDSYQPCESQYKITQKCLELFLKYEFPVTVLTRSSGILENLDIWRKLAQKKIGVVGLSITRPTTLDAHVKHFLEPASSGTEQLLKTLKILHDNEIPTFVFVNPIVPFLTDNDHSLQQHLKEIADTGCKNIFFGVMKLNPLSWGLFKERLKTFDNSLIRSFENLYIKQGKKEFNRSWQPSYEYRQKLYRTARGICQSLNIGFSCEGDMYHLWLNDWADIESPYRYPTGYNLWKIIKNSGGEEVSFDEIKNILISTFPILSKKYFDTLEVLWNQKKIFADLIEIKPIANGSNIRYIYEG
jgi:DNA repair photolyase